MSAPIDGGRPVGGGGDTKTDVKKLFKDKRFLAAGGVVVLLGAVVAFRRSSGGGGGAGIGGDAQLASKAGYVQGSGDTTGTDIASFLSNYTSNLMAGQSAFYNSIKDLLDKDGDVDDPPTNDFKILPITNFRDASPTRNGGPWWSDQQELKWDKVTGAVGYTITELGTTGLKFNIGDVDSYWFNGLIPQGSYHWKIDAKDAQGNIIGSGTLYNTHTAG